MSFILKFADVAVQPNKRDSNIRRAVGFVEVENLFPLLDSAALAPNPRSARRNSIIEKILGSLQEPEAGDNFRYKSRGLLISSHKVEELERHRFRLRLSKDFADGVLDGGHNLFAIGLFALSGVLEQQEVNRIKTWDDLDAAWGENVSAIKKSRPEYGVQVAVELIFPASNPDAEEAFDQAVFEISQARNANTQVKTEAFQNKLGFYDVLKDALPEELSRRVEWKPGVVEDAEAKPISVRDIVALAWIPLNVANEEALLPLNISVLPQNIYRNKGECSDKFNALMLHDSVTAPIGGKTGQVRKLKHKTVESCLKIAADLPRLFDLIYEEFPKFYNAGGFRFGRRNVVKMFDPEKIFELRNAEKDTSHYTAVRPVTPFFRRTSPTMRHVYPDALITPFVTGLSALMKVSNGRIVWSVGDVDSVVRQKLEKAAPLFDGQLDAYDWDPQRLAKSPSSHKQAHSYYKVL